MIKKLDHLVITTADPNTFLAFYEKLGFQVRTGQSRYELFAGDFKINVHQLGKELKPNADHVQTGSADLCFEISGSLEGFRQELIERGLQLETGIVSRTGVRGEMNSLYLRDPDGSLLEFCSYEK